MVKRPSAEAAGEPIPAPDDDLCLAYANTRYWRGTATPTEDLRGIDDLLRWAETTERLPPAMVQHFAARWHDEPGAIFSEAIALRETIFRCFAATASQRAPAEPDIASLNAALTRAPPRQRVCRGGWDVGAPEPSASALLAPALWSAADLLVGNQLARVRQCANPECSWLFLDNSKSGNRRWCSMSACGNRAKAHRHYIRSKDR